MSEYSVGVIGFGAIGGDVATQLLAGAAGSVRIVALVRNDRAARQNGIGFVFDNRDFIAERPDVVVEAAGHRAICEHVVPVLEAGIPVIIASVGALADEAVRERVRLAAERGGTRFIAPDGAVGGLDYLRTVAGCKGLRVQYCSRKPVAAWKTELADRGYAVDVLDHEVVLFEGTARQAALSFPKNLNVALALALAGAGMNGTEVRVVADPSVASNTHEVTIRSEAGHARFVFENSPSAANPKTSGLTALSIIQAIRESRVGLQRDSACWPVAQTS